AALFAHIDRLAYLRPPGFGVVQRWRCEQEHGYLAQDGAERAAAAMTDEQVARFIAHYERLTRWIMDEMPGRADVTIQLDEARSPVSLSVRA
ncbi:MAG: kinase, partial [Verrucomicrobia bacterium]|nr:kinase [Verrucomicrobiota bacterium]